LVSVTRRASASSSAETTISVSVVRVADLWVKAA
jgi:hypothetical protein